MKTLKGRDRTREIVRIRDKYTCQDCGKVWKKGERRFDIHHTKGMCGKLSKTYDKVDDLSGMITLCHKCHFNRPEHKCQSKEWTKRIVARIVPISEYKKIYKLRQQRYKLQEIGEMYGVSRERIRQILLIHNFI